MEKCRLIIWEAITRICNMFAHVWGHFRCTLSQDVIVIVCSGWHAFQAGKNCLDKRANVFCWQKGDNERDV